MPSGAGLQARHCGRTTAFYSSHPRGTARPVTKATKRWVQALPNDAIAQSVQPVDRRQMLAAAAAAACALVTARPAYADDAIEAVPAADDTPAPAAPAPRPSAPSLVSYNDSRDQYTISMPNDWATGEGELDGNASFTGASGSRRTVAWFPTDGTSARDVNITLVMSNTSMEFTKLGSFGNAFQFGTNLVNSMDRSYLLRARTPPKEPIQIARLEDAVERSDMYYIDYTIEKLPEAKKHLYSLVALGYNGTYNRLYTLTAQCPETESDKYKPLFDKVFKSFKPPAKKMY